MDVTDFNHYLNRLLDKISREEKNIFLLGDFNINLLNYNKHRPTNDFLDSLHFQLSSPFYTPTNSTYWSLQELY